jgi:hypothetical protein
MHRAVPRVTVARDKPFSDDILSRTASDTLARVKAPRHHTEVERDDHLFSLRARVAG